MVDVDVRSALTPSVRRRDFVMGPQSRVPLATSYTNAKKNTAQKTNIAQKPKTPSSPWLTA